MGRYTVPVPPLQPLPLTRARSLFSHPDWIFELKWDGFRALAFVDNGRCTLVSRNGNEFKSFPTLNESIQSISDSAVLDGEIVCLDRRGKPQFDDLFFRCGEPRFVAFDLLRLDGEDLRYTPLMERKAKLRALVANRTDRLMYCDHIEADGEKLFKLACKRDLEGIVAKRKYDPYIEGSAQWLKIRNTAYSQWVGREKLFERERERDPDVYLWDACAVACESV